MSVARVLVVVERQPGAVDELSLQAVTFARALASGAPVHALVVGAHADSVTPTLGEHGVTTVHVAEDEVFGSYAPLAVARATAELAGRLQPTAVVAAGSERGNEVLAHLGALLDLPRAA